MAALLYLLYFNPTMKSLDTFFKKVKGIEGVQNS